MLFARSLGSLRYTLIHTQHNKTLLFLVLSMSCLIKSCQHSPDRSHSFEAKVRQTNQCVGLHKQNLRFQPLPYVYRPIGVSKYDKFLHHNPVQISPWTFSVQFIKPCLIDFKIKVVQYIFPTLERDLFLKPTVVKKKVPSRSNSILHTMGVPEALTQTFEMEKTIAHYLRLCNPFQSASFHRSVPGLDSSTQTINYHTTATYIKNIQELMKNNKIDISYTDLSNSTLLYLACEHGGFDAIPSFLELAKIQKVPLTVIPRNNGKLPLQALQELLQKLNRQSHDRVLIEKCASTIQLISSFTL